MNRCAFCFRGAADGVRLTPLEETEWGEQTYICDKCDLEWSLERQAEWENSDCGCSRTDFQCGHPHCRGLLS